MLESGIPSSQAMTLSPAERDELIDRFARKVVGRNLETPAVFMLEAHKPLAFLMSQAMLFGAPLMGAFFGFRNMELWARLLEDRENYDRLISRIEELADSRKRTSGEGRARHEE